MKKGCLFLISTLALALAGCVNELPDGPLCPTSGKLRITLDVERIDTGVESATRATIPAENNEDAVADLHLLFYDHVSIGSADRSGAWVATVAAPALSLGNPRFEIAYADVPALVEGNEYVILAVANLGDYIGTETQAQFLTRMASLTEKEALEQTALTVRGVGTDETDNSAKIDPSRLPMSARAVVERGAGDVTVKLTRGVSRFDIEVAPATHTLVSASIWGAAAGTLLWDETDVNPTERLQRFYGLAASEFIATTPTTFRGGLYAFENYVAAPQPTDEVTTCVILGLAPTSSPANVTYYRVNINLAGAPQNLVRNHVYRIRVNSISGAGADTEYDAWRQSNTRLSFSINDWNLDEGGLALTDGINTLIMPAKKVELDPAGESLHWTVFTKGTGTLRISKNSFKGVDTGDATGSPTPDGTDDIDIFLEPGTNLLRVEAQPLTGTTERRGSIELSYAGLRGTISFVQAPMEGSLHLTLDRYDIPDFLSLGRGGISDNRPLRVTASGPWTATIYNTSEDPYNPGFSFGTATVPVTTLRSGDNPYGNLFTIHTTGDNSRDEARHGFVIVTLDEDPLNYQRVVVLTQAGNQGIALNPEPAGGVLRFSGLGVPQGVSDPSREGGFVFTVDAGRTNGAPNPWSAALTTGSGEFEVIDSNHINGGDLAPDQFRVISRGANLTPAPLTGTLRIEILGGSTVFRTFSLSQATIGLSLTTRGTEVSKAGGRIEGVTVNIDPDMMWEATILSNDPKNPGYLGTTPGTTTASGTGADKLVAGFPKLHYPHIDHSPRMEIEVRIQGSAAGSSTATLVVTQQPLTPRLINTLDVRQDHWGSLTAAPAFQYYASYFKSTALYGVYGKVKTGGYRLSGLPISASYDPREISTDYNYLHAGGVANTYSQARHNAINNWWDNHGRENGVLVYVNDDPSGAIFAGGGRTTVLSRMGVTYTGAASGGVTAGMAPNNGSRVFDYMVDKGPFGQVGTLNSPLWTDGISSTAGNLPTSAVPLVVDRNGKTLLFVDPVNSVVFIGEAQLFDIYMHAPGVLAGANSGPYPANSRLLGNLLAYIVNSAQYGSHFTDLFRPGGEALYDAAFN
ncbi:MAG: hypothetical protein LBV38_00660 [Alistipes sp.]|jgi:hypothetical protein|nr:hypothetical protein [Alistipes sp.]